MKRLVCAVLCVFVGQLFAVAQVIPGRWDKVDALARGSQITVTLAGGDRTDNAFIRSDADVLVLLNGSGSEIRLAKSDVQTVTQRTQDPVRNGVLIGAATGFGVGFLGLAAFNAKETASGPIWDGESVGIYTSAGLVGAGIGALTGLIVDAGRSTTQLLYSRR